MASDSGKGGRGHGANAPEELPQHPLVDRLKPDPAQPARKIVILIGFPGKSDRPNYQRLYLTSKLDFYAEFQISDMVHTETVPADQSPIAGHETTSVTIARDATIHYIWAKTSPAIDEFDLDIRLGTPGAAMASIGLPTHVATCFPDGSACETCNGTCDNTCHGLTCLTSTPAKRVAIRLPAIPARHVATRPPARAPAKPAATQCNQATCANTCQTCQTQCNQATCATCQTCQTQCNQATCHTCHTRCAQATCLTCATCDDTCHRTCVTCVHPHCPLPQ